MDGRRKLGGLARGVLARTGLAWVTRNTSQLFPFSGGRPIAASSSCSGLVLVQRQKCVRITMSQLLQCVRSLRGDYRSLATKSCLVAPDRANLSRFGHVSSGTELPARIRTGHSLSFLTHKDPRVLVDDRIERLYRRRRRQDPRLSGGGRRSDHVPSLFVSKPFRASPHVAYYQLNSKLSNQNAPQK